MSAMSLCIRVEHTCIVIYGFIIATESVNLKSMVYGGIGHVREQLSVPFCALPLTIINPGAAQLFINKKNSSFQAGIANAISSLK